jgi:uncharacterized protein (DUF2062 family)
MSPSKLGLGMAWGLVLGIIPLIGISTLLSAIVAFVFRINMGVIQLVNYLVYPLQLLLFVPFIKLGIYSFGANPLPYPIEEIWSRLQTNFLYTISDIWLTNLLGILVWLIISPILYMATYFGSKYLINKISMNKRPEDEVTQRD